MSPAAAPAALRIRPATAGDAARCAEIYAPFVTDTCVSFEEEAPDAAEMARRIAAYGASHGWFVAERMQAAPGGPETESDPVTGPVVGPVVGYAYGSPHKVRAAYRHSADIGIYVDPAFARQGVGRALLGALLPALGDKGMHAVFAVITLPNPASIALHEAMGFAPVGICRETGWKMGGWRDVGWWQNLL